MENLQHSSSIPAYEQNSTGCTQISLPEANVRPFRNPFPDEYFKALYPGLIGHEKTQMVRLSETELFVRDFRKNPDPEAGETIPYPQPIPY